MRKMIIDESIPFEQRLQQMTDYLKSLYTRERVHKSEKFASAYNMKPKSSICKDLNKFKDVFKFFAYWIPVLKIIFKF